MGSSGSGGTHLEEQDIGIQITDYAMPQMTGGELAFADAEGRRSVKIIVTTGYAVVPGGRKGRYEMLGSPT